MPSTYDKLGIRFQFPDNWSLDENEARDSGNAVSVYSPGAPSGRSRFTRWKSCRSNSSTPH